jgi:hypothetical protein
VKRDAVPQDQSPTYGGHRKLLYATDDRGEYTGVQSNGWDAEAQATLMAVDELNALRDEALQRARRGEASPLEYHMYQRRMDIMTLSQTSGVAKWRVKRHLQPRRFASLPQRLLSKYADALGLSVEALRALPEQP